MKNLYILFLLLAFQIPILQAQDCNIGTTNDLTLQNMTANYLLGNQYNLSENGVLQSINIIGNHTGTNVQMAVYTDNAGRPGNLVVAANAGLVVGGTVTFPVTPTQLYTGNYWIMAVFSSGGEATFGDGGYVAAYYEILNFGSPMPNVFTSTQHYYSDALCYFLEISCGNLGLDDNEQDQILVYPNPSQGLVNIDLGNLQEVAIKVVNLTGQVVYSQENINSSNYQFEFDEATGIYVVEITSNKGKYTYKLIME